VVYLLCLWDVETLVLIVPPGGETLALRTFNLLHYGHNPQVNALCLALLAMAVLPLVTWMFWGAARSWIEWRRMVSVAPAVVLFAAAGCSPPKGNVFPVESKLFKAVQIIGTRGTGVGELNKPRGVAVVGVNSNDVANYPADSPAKMAVEAASAGYTFRYLYDESQEVAKAYRAACTPDLYIFDKDQRLVYRGQFDDSRPGNGLPVTGKDAQGALDALLAGKAVSATQKPSIGCNIKWKPGNEPEYF